MSKCPTLESLAIWMDEGTASGGLAGHIAVCPKCAAFVQDLKADQILLGVNPQLPDSTYADVRQSVLQKVSGGKSQRYYWAAAAIAATLAVAVFLPREQPLPPAPRSVIATQSSKQLEMKQPAIQRVASKRKKSTAPKTTSAELIAALDALYETRMPSGSGQPGQTIITLETQDPKVTILLIAESTGDQQ